MNAVSCLANIKTISPRTEGLNKQYSQNTLILTLISVVNIWMSIFHRPRSLVPKTGLSLSGPFAPWLTSLCKLRCLEEILWTSEVPNCKMLSSNHVTFHHRRKGQLRCFLGWCSGVFKGGKVVDVSSQRKPTEPRPSLKKLVFAISGKIMYVISGQITMIIPEPEWRGFGEDSRLKLELWNTISHTSFRHSRFLVPTFVSILGHEPSLRRATWKKLKWSFCSSTVQQQIFKPLCTLQNQQRFLQHVGPK